MFTNEPPSDDPKFFGGRALTYYGRWTYKYEEAIRKGASRRSHHPHYADRRLRLGRRPLVVGQGRSASEARARVKRRWPSPAG